MERQERLKQFMAWCNTYLLEWKKNITAEYSNDFKHIYIRRIDGCNFFSFLMLHDVIEASIMLNLCCFVQYYGQIEIEIY